MINITNLRKDKKNKFDWDKYGWVGFIVSIAFVFLLWNFFPDIMSTLNVLADRMYANFITLVIIGIIIWLIYRGITRKD